MSINVAPELRGQGIGTLALKAAANFLRGLGWRAILAEIRRNNPASLHCFQNAGFNYVDSISKTIADSGETVPISRYLLTLVDDFSLWERILIVAEAGSNWRVGSAPRDRAMARTLIEAAAEAGADAIKFQTYRPETVYVENAGDSDYLSQAGITESIRDIFADLSMPYEMIPELAEHCRKCGIIFMSTPFSPADFRALDPHVPMHKIASYEISHTRLLEMAGASGKPLILSTGASTEEDIQWALDTFRQAGGEKIVLMQCTAKYPAPLSSLNLLTIPCLARRFGVPTGLSDHSRHPLYGPLAAAALGARVIEKHFTLHNRLPGPDHAFAVTAQELGEMVKAVRAVEEMLGSGEKVVLADEQELALYARRGLQATRDIKAGEILREGENVDILRPGKQRLGLHPLHLKRIQGKPAAKDIPLGQGLQEGDWLE